MVTDAPSSASCRAATSCRSSSRRSRRAPRTRRRARTATGSAAACAVASWRVPACSGSRRTTAAGTTSAHRDQHAAGPARMPSPTKIATNTGASTVPSPSSAFSISTARPRAPGWKRAASVLRVGTARPNPAPRHAVASEQDLVRHRIACRRNGQLTTSSVIEATIERETQRAEPLRAVARHQPGPEQRRRDRKHHLRQEHRAVLRARQAVARRAREDRACRRERDQGDALDEPGHVDGAGIPLARPRTTTRAAPRRCSPTRIAFAIAVSAGFTAPMLGKKLVSTTYRLSSSCALQFVVEHRRRRGRCRTGTCPTWCATPAIGTLMCM